MYQVQSSAKINFRQKAKVLHIYRVGQKKQICLSADNSVMVSVRKTFDTSKVSECCKEQVTNLHSKAFKYSLPNLHKYSSPPKFCQIWL